MSAILTERFGVRPGRQRLIGDVRGQPAPFGSNGTTTGSGKTKYSINSSPLGLASTITDQGNKSRTMVIDGLGRIEQATEDGISAVTSYHSDLLNNIQEVRSTASNFGCTGQGTPYRSFAYDSLGRLWWTCNPENGAITYAYYDNSNLWVRQDAMGKYSVLSYDAPNRHAEDIFRQYAGCFVHLRGEQPHAGFSGERDGGEYHIQLFGL